MVHALYVSKNMESIEHNVVCDLRWGGFDGDDVNQVLSDTEMMLERRLRCQMAYSPCVMGPCSWFIIITISGAAAKIGEGFLKKFGEDLYRWSKECLKPVFTKKSNGDGWAELVFDDSKIEIPFHPSEDAFADCMFCISDIVKRQDLSSSKAWTVEQCDEGLGFKLVPSEDQ